MATSGTAGLHSLFLSTRALQIRRRWALLRTKFISASSVEATLGRSCSSTTTETVLAHAQDQPLLRVAPTVSGSSSSSTLEDESWMRLALEQARTAAAAGDVPVGAVLLGPGGELLAAAGNAVEATGDPTAHAEMLCIRQASARLSSWRLLGSTLYVTLEPCPMCAGAALQARVGSLVYGARNPLLGADGSWISMLPTEEHEEARSTGGGCWCGRSGCDEQPAADGVSKTSRSQPPPPSRPRLHPFHPSITVRRGVLEAECSAAMKAFFRKRRQQHLSELSPGRQEDALGLE